MLFPPQVGLKEGALVCPLDGRRFTVPELDTAIPVPS